jgi:hypothetical protein
MSTHAHVLRDAHAEYLAAVDHEVDVLATHEPSPAGPTTGESMTFHELARRFGGALAAKAQQRREVRRAQIDPRVELQLRLRQVRRLETRLRAATAALHGLAEPRRVRQIGRLQWRLRRALAAAEGVTSRLYE